MKYEKSVKWGQKVKEVCSNGKKEGIVTYISPNGWYQVTFQGKKGNYRECFKMKGRGVKIEKGRKKAWHSFA